MSTYWRVLISCKRKTFAFCEELSPSFVKMHACTSTSSPCQNFMSQDTNCFNITYIHNIENRCLKYVELKGNYVENEINFTRKKVFLFKARYLSDIPRNSPNSSHAIQPAIFIINIFYWTTLLYHFTVLTRYLKHTKHLGTVMSSQLPTSILILRYSNSIGGNQM